MNTFPKVQEFEKQLAKEIDQLDQIVFFQQENRL